jgi:hypothetical protein
VLKQVTGDTHANIQDMVKRTRTAQTNYSEAGFRKTKLQRELS